VVWATGNYTPLLDNRVNYLIAKNYPTNNFLTKGIFNMKRTLITRALAAFVLLLAVCAGANAGGRTDGNATNNAGLSLMDAIEQTAEKITGDLPAGSRRVAIVAFESANDNLSDYIMEELTGALFDRKIEVADRQNLEFVYKELFQRIC